MSILTNLLTILKRPVAPPPPAAAPAGRKAPTSPEASPITDAELREAIAEAAAERQIAMDIINSAETRREALLFVEGSDDEIGRIGREVDSASLMLERLDRLEPELMFRLDQVRDRDRVARWLILRDEYVRIGRAHIEALRAIRQDVPSYNKALRALTAEFPDAWETLPQLYFFDQRITSQLENKLNRFSTLAYRSQAQPATKVMESLVDIAKRGETTFAFGGLQNFDDSDRQTIKLKVPAEINGRWHAVGSVLRISKWLAENEVACKRAILVADGEML